MIRIVVDCMGGDNSPGAQVSGCLNALKKNEDLSLILTGDETLIRSCLPEGAAPPDRLEIVHAPDVITGEDKPTDAIRLKKESSMMKAVRLLQENEDIRGMVTTGATGALVAAGTLRIGRLQGVRRPTFCPVMPTMAGSVVAVADSGANVECSAEMLLQFALMGSLYLENAYGVEKPRVALLNVGTETEKGDTLRKEAFRLLSNCTDLNFVGNMESRDLLSGKFDLVVCDGFSGNVLIKSTEGACLELLKKLKKEISSKTVYKMGALLMMKMFKDMKEFMNYQNYGGSVLLGTRKTMVKGHGSSNEVAVEKCIEQAYRMENSQLRQKMTEAILSHPLAGEEETCLKK